MPLCNIMALSKISLKGWGDMGFNNSVEGKTYSKKEMTAIWDKATVVDGYEPDMVRKDKAGAWMIREKYGYDGEELGVSWEVDHILPKAQGGSDELDNLQPLQGLNNRAKCDDCPQWKSKVTSDGDRNVFKEQSWTI